MIHREVVALGSADLPRRLDGSQESQNSKWYCKESEYHFDFYLMVFKIRFKFGLFSLHADVKTSELMDKKAKSMIKCFT